MITVEITSDIILQTTNEEVLKFTIRRSLIDAGIPLSKNYDEFQVESGTLRIFDDIYKNSRVYQWSE